jgi:hypothetical protein
VTATTVTVNLDTRSLDTGVYTLAVQNPGATASNQVSFSVMPGQPSLDTIAVGASPPATAACVVQSSTPVTITLAGSNFALPDAQGNGASQVMYSADGTTWNPVPAAINVRAWNQITALFDTRNAVAGVTYSISVWNAPGPMKSAQARTLKVAATSCP